MSNYEIYVFGLEGFFSSIQQRVTITGDGSAIIFRSEFSIKMICLLTIRLGSSSQALAEYAQVVTADSSGNIVININPIGGTQDVVLGGIAIAEIVREVAPSCWATPTTMEFSITLTSPRLSWR